MDAPAQVTPDEAPTERLPLLPPPPPEMMGRTLALWVLGILVASVPVSWFNDYAGTLVLGGGFAYLCRLRRGCSADIFGLIMVAFCAAPFLRRIHDFHLGYNPFSSILLAPYLCFLPLAGGVASNLRKLRTPDLIPFVLVLGAMFYAFLVGTASLGLVSSAVGAVEWCSGPFLYLYFVLQGGRIDNRRVGIWFTWIVVVEAVYGLYQWAYVPPYDTKWLMDSGMYSSMGEPLPFRMRTFGTLNATGVLAFVCAVYLIMGLSWRYYLLVALPTFAALATTLVRAAWIITILGIVLVLVLQGGRDRIRMFAKMGALVGILVVAGTPLLSRFDDLQKRFDSMRNVSGDGSYRDRHALMEAAVGAIMATPEGAGIGSVGRGARLTKNGIGGVDNGFIAMTYVLGWAGVAAYLGVFLLITLQVLFQGDPSERAPVGALSLALLASNVFGMSFVDLGGIICWTALAMGFLGRREMLARKAAIA